MTPVRAPGIAVEYRFQCFCGAPIVATEKTAKCAKCGGTLGIRRVKRQHWKIAPPELPHRKLQASDLQTLAIRIAGSLLWVYGVYVLGQYVYELVNS